MSRYVQLLLLSAEEIKTAYGEQTLEDIDLYDDLIAVEEMIKTLYKHGYISDFDLLILNYVRTNKSFRKLEKQYNISRLTLSSKFKKLCEKIAFFLGHHFSDRGYFLRLKEKYRLNDYEVKRLSDYFFGKKKDAMQTQTYN